jgi:hypothetical protein
MNSCLQILRLSRLALILVPFGSQLIADLRNAPTADSVTCGDPAGRLTDRQGERNRPIPPRKLLEPAGKVDAERRTIGRRRVPRIADELSPGRTNLRRIAIRGQHLESKSSLRRTGHDVAAIQWRPDRPSESHPADCVARKRRRMSDTHSIAADQMCEKHKCVGDNVVNPFVAQVRWHPSKRKIRVFSDRRDHGREFVDATRGFWPNSCRQLMRNHGEGSFRDVETVPIRGDGLCAENTDRPLIQSGARDFQTIVMSA